MCTSRIEESRILLRGYMSDILDEKKDKNSPKDPRDTCANKIVSFPRLMYERSARQTDSLECET